MSNTSVSTMFEALIMVCSVGIQPSVETCSIPTLGIFTERKLCRDTIDAFKNALPPNRRIIMADCAPAATKKIPTRRVDLD